jgi:signal transduction histidine kinase
MGTHQTERPPARAQVQSTEDDRLRLIAELELRTRQLEESEARFRDVIERNADAIIVVDHEGIVRFANPETERLFGTPRQDLLGSAFGFPVVVGETTELDLPHNGVARVVEMRVVESQWQGEPACIATLRDVTQRKRAEQSERRLIREQTARTAAEEAVRRFRFLAESSTTLSSSLNYSTTLAQLVRLCVEEIADWSVVYCIDKENQLRRYEVAHKDATKQGLINEFRDSPLMLRPSNPIEQAMQTGQPVVVKQLTDEQIESLIPDPETRRLACALGLASFMMIPITARGRSLGAIALICATAQQQFDDQDLALAENLAARAGLAIDNARLYEEAREANQTKTELLAVISHDLRTPLNSIIGYTQLLEMGIPEPLADVSRERVQRIHQSAGHLLYLIDELLAFARVEGNHEDVNPRPVDAARIVREVAELMEPLAQEKHLQLYIDVPEYELILETDADKLRQVLVNLVGNSVKYTKAGEIRLVLDGSAADQVALRVSDTGVGIAPEHLPHIFEPFWQVDRSQRTLGGGTGLGLSVVQRVITLLRGKITVESVVGNGSTFTISLPR